MQGYDIRVKIGPPQSHGFEQEGTLTESWLLDAEGATPDKGEDFRERTGKINQGRWQQSGEDSIEQEFPRLEIPIQPRTDDILPILMAAFQCVHVGTGSEGTVISGTYYGTMTFVPIDDAPDFSGTAWGTFNNHDTTGTVVTGDVYPLQAEVMYGAGFTGTNVLEFKNGVVDSLRFRVAVGEDLICTPSIWFHESGTHKESLVSFETNAMRSAEHRMVDWRGTASIGGTSYELEAWETSVLNGLDGKGALGTKGYSRFRFQSRFHEGAFDKELGDELEFDTFRAGNTAAITMTFFYDAGEWIQISQPNCMYRANTPEVPSAENPVMFTTPYKAYGNNNGAGTEPPTTIKVCGSIATNYFDPSGHAFAAA